MAQVVIFGGYSRLAFATKPMGCYVLANTFRNLGMSVQVIDYVFNWSTENMKALVRKHCSDSLIICLSTTLAGATGDNNPTMECCDRLFEPIMLEIKKVSPNAKFIVGGSKITQGQRTKLPFDYGVIGQCEGTIPAVYNSVFFGDYLEGFVEGKTVYISDKKHPNNGFSTSTVQYLPGDVVMRGEALPVELGRGCVFKCSFCSYDLNGKKFGDYNKENGVVRDYMISNYEKYGTTRYQFTDDTLNDSEEKIQNIKAIVESLPFKIQFSGYMRIEHFVKFPHSAALFKKLGLVGANFGIETFNGESGKTIGKGYGDKYWEVLKHLRQEWKDDVLIHANFIVGLPHDSEELLWAYHNRMLESGLVDHAVYSPLTIGRKSDSLFSTSWNKLYTEVKQLPNDNPKTIQYFGSNINWVSPHMDLTRAVELSRELNADFVAGKTKICNAESCFAMTSLLSVFTPLELRTLEWKEEQVSTRIKKHLNTKIQNYYLGLMGVESEQKTEVFKPQRVKTSDEMSFPVKFVEKINVDTARA